MTRQVILFDYPRRKFPENYSIDAYFKSQPRMEGFYIALGMFVSTVSTTQYDQVSLIVSLKSQGFPALYNIISLMVPHPILLFSRTNLRLQSAPEIYEGCISWAIHNASFTQSYTDLCLGLSHVQSNFELILEMVPNQENMLDFFFGFILGDGCSIVPPSRLDRANGEAFRITHNDLPGLQLIANMLNRVMRVDVERPVASVGPYCAAGQHKYILHVDYHASLRLLEHLKGIRSRGLYLSAKLDETEHILRYGGLSENQQSAYHLGLTLDEFRGPPHADGTYHPAVLALTYDLHRLNLFYINELMDIAGLSRVDSIHQFNPNAFIQSVVGNAEHSEPIFIYLREYVQNCIARNTLAYPFFLDQSNY